jgi:hypothetical protein
MPNEIERRLHTLRSAADVLEAMRAENRDKTLTLHGLRIEAGVRMLRRIADYYELAASTRRGPKRAQRVVPHHHGDPEQPCREPECALDTCKHCRRPVRGPHELTCGSDGCLGKEYGKMDNRNVDEENEG